MNIQGPHPAVRPTLVLESAGEVLGTAPNTIQLLLDAPEVGGYLSATRIRLGEGKNGATPHIHRSAAELFFILDGALQVLVGEQVEVARRGDVLLVPPHTVHAFGAAPGCSADALIVVTPGVERSAYFRLLDRIGRGEAEPAEVFATQDRFDNLFVQSDVWRDVRQSA